MIYASPVTGLVRGVELLINVGMNFELKIGKYEMVASCVPFDFKFPKKLATHTEPFMPITHRS